MLKKLLAAAELQATNVILGLRQELMPTWAMITKDYDVIIRATPWSNDWEKNLAGMFMRVQLKKHAAVAYSFVTEAWMANAPKGWDPDSGEPLREEEQASKHPERRECVIAFATDGKKTLWRRWLIKRDWNEQVTKLEQLPDDDATNFDSWMTGLLK